MELKILDRLEPTAAAIEFCKNADSPEANFQWKDRYYGVSAFNCNIKCLEKADITALPDIKESPGIRYFIERRQSDETINK